MQKVSSLLPSHAKGGAGDEYEGLFPERFIVGNNFAGIFFFCVSLRRRRKDAEEHSPDALLFLSLA